VNAPPNVATPEAFARAAAKVADEYSDRLSLRVLELEDCEKLNMGSYLCVAQGSSFPPKFLHLTYSHGTPRKTVVLIGKGITFDTGGVNLKTGPASMIELMKFDCGCSRRGEDRRGGAAE